MTEVSRQYYGEVGEDKYESPTFYWFSGWYCAYEGASRTYINSGSYTTYNYGVLVTQPTYIYREWSGTEEGHRRTPCSITVSYKYGNGETGTFNFTSGGDARYERYYASQLARQVSYKVPGWLDE